MDSSAMSSFGIGSIVGLTLGLVALTTLTTALVLAYNKRRLLRLPISAAQQVCPLRNMHFVLLSREVQTLEVPRATVVLSASFLGKGNFGVVYKGTATNLPYQEGTTTVAVKYAIESGEETERKFLKEVSIMAEIGRHLNIVNLLAVVVKGEQLMVLEYCQNGSLRKYLRKHQGKFFYNHVDYHGNLLDFDKAVYKFMQQQCEEQQFLLQEDFDARILSTSDLVSFSYQISRGMVFLSKKGIIHRDLAARNILLGQNLLVKISDFGMAIKSNGEINSLTEAPVKWMAPEAIRSRKFSEKSDVWSYGVLLWEIFSLGESPYQDLRMKGTAEDFLSLLENGYRLDKPAASSNEIYDLMQNCWCTEDKMRPTFSDLRVNLQHWIGEDYYLNLDQAYNDYNFHLDTLFPADSTDVGS